MIHYITLENNKIKQGNIVYTLCGKYWVEAYALTTEKNKVTCQKCRLKLQKHEK
jgi:hypothetical protein